ncbi:hypothetical protein M6D81_08460, partial [Paenibacillus sp. J5C_2022]|uniref:hypothetical protein n=1 Tax=Paenibacillus sp. J5C2022 TaxID=2977129 RepID=UPI0021CEE5F3
HSLTRGSLTSEQSQVIRDVQEVFRQQGFKCELIQVKLNNANVIAEGIASADEREYDVILIVRGGGHSRIKRLTVRRQRLPKQRGFS